MLYDVYPCSDKGYIGVGLARPDMGTDKLWIIKVDSMGCDTAGCATGTHIFKFPVTENPELFNIYPNPAHEYFIVELLIGNLKGAEITIFDSKGLPKKKTNIPGKQQHMVVNINDLKPGVYLIKIEIDGRLIESKKISKLY